MILAAATCTLLTSCYNKAESKLYDGKENDSIIQVFAYDTILTYQSSGSVVHSEGGGYYFVDSQTGKIIKVSGTIVVTEK